MLKLVYINPNPTLANQSNTFSRYSANNVSVFRCPTHPLQEMGDHFLSHFTAEICLVKPGLYKVVARDPFHYLSCTLVLEVRESDDESEFRIKVLEQLLLFCANCNALKLIIYIDSSKPNEFKDFNNFITHRDQVITCQGRAMALIIPTDRTTYDNLIEYREQMRAAFQEFLYENQDTDPLVQQYITLSTFG